MDRNLPYDVNAEAAIISALMIDSTAVPKAIEAVDDSFFYRQRHKYIFQAIHELFKKNIEIDPITIIDELKRNSNLEKAGDRIYISELSDVVLSSANLDYHLKIISEKAILRKLINSSNEIINKCYDENDEITSVVDFAEKNIFSVTQNPGSKSFIRVNEILPDTIAQIEKIASTKVSVQGIPSGYPDIDKRTGGFKPGQFIVLAARPAMGKTSLALNMAYNQANFHNKKVALFTMEMSDSELLTRILSIAAEVPMDALIKGFGMDEGKIQRLIQVSEGLETKDIYIDDSGNNSSTSIKAKSRRLKAEIGGLDIIYIDYLQLMNESGSKENRQQEISTISRSLKILAKELEVPVVALSQLNRGLESRDNKRPKLSDLRESGAIEQDADMVMFIYRDEYYNGTTEDNKKKAELIIGKNRQGPPGTIQLIFEQSFTRFDSSSNLNDDFH